MVNDTTINLRLNAARKDGLAIVAEQEERSMAQVIRLAISEYLARKGVK